MSLSTNDHLPVCVACGTQFPHTNPQKCRICDDPRQFVPPSGQSFTTLAQMRGKYKNRWTQDSANKGIWSVETVPKFGIGQRAILLQTPEGNVLWDLIAYLDQETVDFITSLGPLQAIVISHPHYYTTLADWSRTFRCPVYTSADDSKWLEADLIRSTPGAESRLIESPTEAIVPGVTAVKTGGHFDGSLVLLWADVLLIADTLVTVPSAHSPTPHAPGTVSYTFMYAIPNMIPLDPDAIGRMWRALKGLDFHRTMGAFPTMDVSDNEHVAVKERVLESMKIQIRAMGWQRHWLLEERL